MNPNPRRDEELGALPRQGPRQQGYQFSPEELRVLRECNRDSFYQRCVPFGTLGGVATYLAIKSGYLRPNAAYGAAPKVVVAVIVGYFFGKFSYQKKCAERLMQLPNSQIGEMLRQRRKGNFKETLEPGLGPAMSLAPFGDVGKVEMYSDLQPGNVDSDTSRPEFDGLDDSHRPSVDNPIYEEEMPPVQRNVTTYEELRKRNREDYAKKRTSSYSSNVMNPPSMQDTLDLSASLGDGMSGSSGVSGSSAGSPGGSHEKSPPVRTNKYGDALL